jgi:hypothetical protein
MKSKSILFSLAVCLRVFAQEPSSILPARSPVATAPVFRPHRGLSIGPPKDPLYWTLAAYAGAAYADAYISHNYIDVQHGCCETNKLISPTGHTFGTRGMAIVMGPSVLLAVVEPWLVRKVPTTKPWLIGLNLALASWSGITAIKDARYASSHPSAGLK